MLYAFQQIKSKDTFLFKCKIVSFSVYLIIVSDRNSKNAFLVPKLGYIQGRRHRMFLVPKLGYIQGRRHRMFSKSGVNVNAFFTLTVFNVCVLTGYKVKFKPLYRVIRINTPDKDIVYFELFFNSLPLH